MNIRRIASAVVAGALAAAVVHAPAAEAHKGNRQIAHAIDRVLRPVDLP